MNEIGKIKNTKIINNITNQPLQRRHGPIGRNNLIGNTVNIANIGNENINDLSKYEQLKILNDKNYALTTFIDNMYFNSRLPNNHSPQSGRIRSPLVNYKFYNSAINDKHINVIENNKIVKKKKTEVYDIMFTPCVKMIENIIIANKKDIKYKQFQECKEIIEFYHTMPIHKKLMKAYHNEVNMMSYNKKDLILNTWNKLLKNNTITEEESNIVKQSIEELKNSNEEFESSSDDDNSNGDNSDDDNNDNKNIIPGIYIKKNNNNNIIKVNQNSDK